MFGLALPLARCQLFKLRLGHGFFHLFRSTFKLAFLLLASFDRKRQTGRHLLCFGFRRHCLVPVLDVCPDCQTSKTGRKFQKTLNQFLGKAVISNRRYDTNLYVPHHITGRFPPSGCLIRSTILHCRSHFTNRTRRTRPFCSGLIRLINLHRQFAGRAIYILPFTEPGHQ